MALNRNSDASAPTRLDQPSFFQSWERRTQSHNRSDSNDESHLSSESSQPSPKSTVGPPRVRKLRQTLAERSMSAPAGTIPELGFPTIASLRAHRESKTADPPDDGPSGTKSHQQRSGDNPLRPQRSISRVGAELKKSSEDGVIRLLSLPDFRIPECRGPNSAKTQSPSRREQSSSEWTKSTLKSDWIERLISTSGIMERRAKSAEPLPMPIMPLRPPPSRDISASGYYHTVKLETSFPILRKEIPPKQPRPSHINPRSSITARTKSIIVKPVRLTFQHRQTADRAVNKKESTCTPAKSSFMSARNRTSEGLQRVASILHMIIAENPSNTASDRSNQSREAIPPSQLKRSHRKGTFHLPAVIRSRAGKSPNVSYTSSIRSMRQGGTPFNTPDPEETYRIKRSPSAETEEFIKIDISIRGGTSYLPSEARRIHTPPLPNNGPGHNQMGFFFDYTAPSSVGPSTAGHVESPREQRRAPPTVQAWRGNTLPCTEWYETQLAQVDAENEGASLSTSMSEVARAVKEKDKEVVNQNVPEHLPNSPLCPRHWKHKSGGKGICWMHGRNVNVVGTS